ncbi:MAG: hypothetical protein LBM02_09015 [Lachnospiraceae bacterium]|jgi:hypothetical protein|nr:hypothetical protein [Lachnospiraceae bacterium]
MKKWKNKKIIIMILGLIIIVIGVVSVYIKYNQDLSANYLVLQNIDKRYPQIIKKLKDKNQIVKYDNQTLYIIKENVKYEFWDSGLSTISTPEGITLLDFETNKNGKVKTFVASLYSGIDSLRARYDLKTMKRHKLFYVFDLSKYEDEQIHKHISNIKMVQYVKSGQVLQNKIKKVLEES